MLTPMRSCPSSTSRVKRLSSFGTAPTSRTRPSTRSRPTISRNVAKTVLSIDDKSYPGIAKTGPRKRAEQQKRHAQEAEIIAGLGKSAELDRSPRGLIKNEGGGSFGSTSLRPRRSERPRQAA